MRQWHLSDGSVYIDTSTPDENSVHIRYSDGREQYWLLLHPSPNPLRLKGQTAEQFVRGVCAVNGYTIQPRRALARMRPGAKVTVEVQSLPTP